MILQHFSTNHQWVDISVTSVIEFARSDSLRRHLSSGVCKEDQKEMSESDEESVVSTRRSYGPGEDILEHMILIN